MRQLKEEERMNEERKLQVKEEPLVVIQQVLAVFRVVLVA